SAESSLAADTAAATTAATSRDSVAAPSARARASRVSLRLVRKLLTILAAYWALCVVLLGAFRFFTPPITGVQLQRRIEAGLAHRPYRQQRTFVPYARIPDAVRHAVVVAEDGRFWKHWGYDFDEMRDAGADVL